MSLQIPQTHWHLPWAFWHLTVNVLCGSKRTAGGPSPPPLTRWCVSWTAGRSRSSPSPSLWSQPGGRWASGRPLGLLSAASWRCGTRRPPRSPPLLQPVGCSAETAPITTHTPRKHSGYTSEPHESQQQFEQTYKNGARMRKWRRYLSSKQSVHIRVHSPQVDRLRQGSLYGRSASPMCKLHCLPCICPEHTKWAWGQNNHL